MPRRFLLLHPVGNQQLDLNIKGNPDRFVGFKKSIIFAQIQRYLEGQKPRLLLRGDKNKLGAATMDPATPLDRCW
jgi:hypothetical protein